jgi:hypothetical protein
VQNNLIPNETTAEGTDSSLVGVTVFGADGFTIGSSSSTSGPYADTTGSGMVAWAWKGGSTHSHENYNATAGFSIIKWTGDDDSMMDSSQTVSHSLGATPDFIIAKNRTNNASGTGSWIVYHKDLTAGDFQKLNVGYAKFTASVSLIDNIDSNSVDFASSSTVVWPEVAEYLNYGGTGMGDEDTYIAYLFSEVAGYSKFGTYTANASDDGPFVWCGFKPSFLIVKRIESSNWAMYDSKRPGYNVIDGVLFPDAADAEYFGHGDQVDFLSNGFKVRFDSVPINYLDDYIFAAFASQPFKYASAR